MAREPVGLGATFLQPRYPAIRLDVVPASSRPIDGRHAKTTECLPFRNDATDYLKVHVMHLRRELGDDANNPAIIATDRSVGYKQAA